MHHITPALLDASYTLKANYTMDLVIWWIHSVGRMNWSFKYNVSKHLHRSVLECVYYIQLHTQSALFSTKKAPAIW